MKRVNIVEVLTGKSLYVLEFDETDPKLLQKYRTMIRKLTALEQRREKEAEAFYSTGRNKNRKQIVEFCSRRMGEMVKVIADVNDLVGENAVQQIFSEEYKADDCFQPTPGKLAEILDSMRKEIERILG
jgi:hypothetical protein